MARSVSLSDDAFRALRAEKREGESDSDVILRLQKEARTRRKDPASFFAHPPSAAWTAEEYERVSEAMRDADRERLASVRKGADPAAGA